MRPEEKAEAALEKDSRDAEGTEGKNSGSEEKMEVSGSSEEKSEISKEDISTGSGKGDPSGVDSEKGESVDSDVSESDESSSPSGSDPREYERTIGRIALKNKTVLIPEMNRNGAHLLAAALR
ncbi:MAG: hypothetical protein ACMUIG_06345, partial [Thermoplasmatota archaeon]